MDTMLQLLAAAIRGATPALVVVWAIVLVLFGALAGWAARDMARLDPHDLAQGQDDAGDTHIALAAMRTADAHAIQRQTDALLLPARRPPRRLAQLLRHRWLRPSYGVHQTHT